MGADYVRGTLKATGDPLPRMPPLRLRGGLRYQYNAFQVGGEVVGAAKQERVSRRRDADGRLHAAEAVRLVFVRDRGAVSTITARLDNATDELYRNHLSLIKDLVPEMGRNFKVLYNVKF